MGAATGHLNMRALQGCFEQETSPTSVWDQSPLYSCSTRIILRPSSSISDAFVHLLGLAQHSSLLILA